MTKLTRWHDVHNCGQKRPQKLLEQLLRPDHHNLTKEVAMASPSIPKVSVKDFAREHKRFAVRASGRASSPICTMGTFL